jgi:1-deoxy-D-xylulose-5-phosphate synthase
MTVIAPKNRYELTKALEYAVEFDGPIAVKYSRGEAFYGLKEQLEPFCQGKSEVIYEGEEVALLAVGNMVEEACEVYEKLKEMGHSITLVNARFIKPVDEELLERLATKHRVIVTLEEQVYSGSYGQAVAAYYMRNGYKSLTVDSIAIEDCFVEHGKVADLRKLLHIDSESVVNRMKGFLD